MRPMPKFMRTSRDTLALTQEQLSERLEMTRQTIIRYEQGDPVPETVRLAMLRLLDECRHHNKHDNKTKSARR